MVEKIWKGWIFGGISGLIDLYDDAYAAAFGAGATLAEGAILRYAGVYGKLRKI